MIDKLIEHANALLVSCSPLGALHHACIAADVHLFIPSHACDDADYLARKVGTSYASAESVTYNGRVWSVD